MKTQNRWMQSALVLFLLLSLSSYAITVQAHPSRTGTIEVVKPDSAGNETIPASRDFATEVIGDPWDMNERTDIFFEMTRDKGGFPNLSLSNGVLSGTNNKTDANIWIMFPGHVSSQMLGHTGVQYPIDATRYRRLVFRMYLSENIQQTDFLQIFWYTHGNFGQNPLTGWGATKFLTTHKGWHTYDIDLPSDFKYGDTNWSGYGVIKGFRIDPVNCTTGVTVKLDWVQLIDPSTASTYDIRWSAVGTESETASLYHDTDPNGSHKQLIVADIPANQCSYTWTPYLAPNGYYIFAELSGGDRAASTGPVVINRPPIVDITAPSMTSGPDYATVVAGNPWDMNGPTDITWTYHVKDLKYENGILNATTTGNDPQLRLNTPVPIDTSKYRYLSFRMWIEGTQDIGTGWVQRIYFYNSSSDPGLIDDIVLYEQWRTYTLDLQNAIIDPTSRHKWTDGQWTWFRFDVDEMPTSMKFHLDYVTLTANDRADSYFNIRWNLDDPDSDDVDLNIYYCAETQDAAMSASPSGNRVLIATVKPDGRVVSPHLSAPAADQPQQTGTYKVYLPLVLNTYIPPCDGEGNCHTWYTSWVSPGDYYIEIEANDGYNTTTWRSETPVEIRH